MKGLYRSVLLGLLLSFLSLGLLAGPSTLDEKSHQVRIAIMGQDDFYPDRTVPGNVTSLPNGLAARLIEYLQATKRFEIVERTALRQVIREQAFGKEKSASNFDKMIEKTVESLPAATGHAIAMANEAADYNDRIDEFQNLGTAVGADYLVYAVLEQHKGSLKSTAVPMSDRGRKSIEKHVDARLRLRVIESTQGRIVGADSIRTQISEKLFLGREAKQDEYSMYDHLGKLSAQKVLDIIFPAQLVSADPWVINRGSNEMVAVNDLYTIEREGKTITDATGVEIGKMRSQVGSAKVTQVQETFSVVEPVSGDFQLNDLALPEKKALTESPDLTASAPALKPQAVMESAQKPRLAVGLVKAGSTATTEFNEHLPSFTDTLISRLTQTQRFQLIDRQEVDQLLDEQLAQSLAKNQDMPSVMGKLKGADYLVLGSVSAFNVIEKQSRLPGSSRTIMTWRGRVEGNMRIVDARSGDIIGSKKVSISQQLPKSGTKQQIITLLSDTYADQVTVNLMNALYPIKVAAVVSGVAYINRGRDGGLSIGETLRAIRPGQAIVDPDTGVQLGVAETELGEITLADVEDARSKAPVEKLALQAGDILYRLAASKNLRSDQIAKPGIPARTGGDASVNDSGPMTIAIGKAKILLRTGSYKWSEENSKRLTDDLMVKFSQFPEFNVMERSEIDQVIDEKSFTAIAAGDDAGDKLGELQGADYILHATVNNFVLRHEAEKIPYTDEIQDKYFGTVDATVRLVDVHTGKLTSAIKIRMNERVHQDESELMAVNDLIDQFTTEIVTRISDDLAARQKDELVPVGRRSPDVARDKAPAPTVNHPNF
ncbi:MAG: CsgG/HfaB family protein [Candidatus Thiodiazotropha sp.]